MSRQIKIRRGSAAEHAEFTGAIGEVTMDTTNNTLRVHDGQTVGGTALAKQDEIPDLSPYDYVIEWQMPTSANNYTWYRKYKSGWVEQGGIWTGSLVGQPHKEVSPVPNISLLVKMYDKNYFATASVVDAYLIHIGQVRSQTNTTFRFGTFGESEHTLSKFVWYVSGKHE